VISIWGIFVRVRFRDVVVPAIREDVLPGVLRRLGLYDDVVNGKAKCYVCGELLTLDSIGAIAMVNDKPVLVCSKPSCIGKIALITSKSKSI
jgi:hypothetical protein